MSLKNFYFQDLVTINYAAVNFFVFTFLGMDASCLCSFFVRLFILFILIFKSSLNVKERSTFSDMLQIFFSFVVCDILKIYHEI